MKLRGSGIMKKVGEGCVSLSFQPLLLFSQQNELQMTRMKMKYTKVWTTLPVLLWLWLQEVSGTGWKPIPAPPGLIPIRTKTVTSLQQDYSEYEKHFLTLMQRISKTLKPENQNPGVTVRSFFSTAFLSFTDKIRGHNIVY